MKYVLITGVSTGIGLASAHYLLERGYGVLGSVRHQTDADRLRSELGSHFHPLLFDVCDAAAVAGARPQVEAIVGEAGLAGLVNNAGIAVSGPLALVPLERIRYQLEVNVLGVIQVTQTFLPLLGAQLPARTRPGRVINISSVSGAFAAPFVGPYCASKYALEALTDSWRRELLLYGIDMISIRPGPIRTPIWQKTIDKIETYPDSDYAPLLRQSEQMIRQSEANSLPAERVAKVVLRALEARRPRTRYIVAKNKLNFHLLFHWIPDRVADFFVRRAFRKMAQS
ncbi:MAG: SDR family oxidoreductase [Bacteroidota bacterium]